MRSLATHTQQSSDSRDYEQKKNTIKAHFLRRGFFNVMHAQKAFAPPTRREASFVSRARAFAQVFLYSRMQTRGPVVKS
jgi:hypothetical protein